MGEHKSRSQGELSSYRAVSGGSVLPVTTDVEQWLEDSVTGTEEGLWSWLRGRMI